VRFVNAYRLVLGGGDLLQEVGDALALRQLEAHALEERQHLPNKAQGVVTRSSTDQALDCPAYRPAYPTEDCGAHTYHVAWVSTTQHTEAHLLAGPMEQYLAVRQEEDVVKHLKHLVTSTCNFELASEAAELIRQCAFLSVLHVQKHDTEGRLSRLWRWLQQGNRHGRLAQVAEVGKDFDDG
jgi:hypothetical protein